MNVSSRWIVFGLGWIVCAGCATDGGTDDSTAAVPVERMEQVNFFDSMTFDHKLSAALRNEPTKVIVEPASPFHVNDIPGRIDKWLFVVQDSGGQVEAVEEKPFVVRGVISEGVDLVILISHFIAEKQTYGPAERYDATVFHDESGMVQKVTFSMR